QLARFGRALMCLHARARMVCMEPDQRRTARQPVHPVCELSLKPFSCEPLALPDSIIGILYGQVGQRRLSACRKGMVKLGHLPNQSIFGPGVRDDVMQG